MIEYIVGGAVLLLTAVLKGKEILDESDTRGVSKEEAILNNVKSKAENVIKNTQEGYEQKLKTLTDSEIMHLVKKEDMESWQRKMIQAEIKEEILDESMKEIRLWQLTCKKHKDIIFLEMKSATEYTVSPQIYKLYKNNR